MVELGAGTSIGLAMLAAMLSICNFSYDAGVINSLNIIKNYLEYFDPDSTYIGLLVAIINIGSIIGVPMAGPILDRFGRKRGLMIGSFIALAGTVIAAAATTKAQLLVGRLFVGMSFIITGAGAPSWMMEIAPPKYRSLVTNGMLSSLPIVGTIASVVILCVYKSNSEWAWRGPLLGEAVGPLVSLLILPFTPESPRWLVAKGREREAFDLLVKLHANGDRQNPKVLLAFKEIIETIAYEKQNASSWRNLVQPAPQFRRFLICVLTNIFYQITGASFMPYFFTLILASAGVVDMKTLLTVSTGLCIWASLSNISGLVLSELFGKKKMLVLGTSIITGAFAILAILTNYVQTTGKTSYGKGAIFMAFIFQWATFSSWMILNFAYPPEILQFSQRARGVSLSQAIGYAFATLMTYTIPIAIKNIAWRYYAINAGWNVLVVGVIWWLFVETKGKTLEEIDVLFDGLVHFENQANETGKPVIACVEV